MLGGEGVRTRVILCLRGCIWNAPAVLLFLFDDTSSLGSPPRQAGNPPGSMVPPWVTTSRFLARNREAELKPNTFSSLLLLLLSYLSSSPDPPAI